VSIKAPREKEFLGQVVQLARLLGWLVYHTHDSRRSAAGFPDLALCHPRLGRLVLAELKVRGRRPSAEQGRWLAALRAAGATAYLWTPADWPAIERVLRDGPPSG